MPEAGFRIERDPARRLVRMTLFGFWDGATLREFQETVLKLAASAPQREPSAGRVRILMDLREHDLLSKEHAAGLQMMLAGIGGSYRTAFVVAQKRLLKKQVERVSSALQPMFFTSDVEALDWLLAPEAA